MAEKRRKLGLARTTRCVTGEEVAFHLAKLREVLDPASFAKVQSQFLRGSHKLVAQIRRKRSGDDGSMPALVEPPRGPKPLAGGAVAPLEFD